MWNISRFLCIAHYALRAGTIDSYIIGFPAKPILTRKKIHSFYRRHSLISVFIGRWAVEVRVIRNGRGR